jgi:hypothetical protein
MTVPTVDEILARTQMSPDLNWWNVNGGAIRVTRATLRKALEDAYDPNMPNWTAMVEVKIDDA